jgi:hypothetical protein
VAYEDGDFKGSMETTAGDFWDAVHIGLLEFDHLLGDVIYVNDDCRD